MAVEIEFINIFVRLETLAKVFPGGRNALWDPEKTWGTHDGEIVRIGAMDDYAVISVVETLKSWGLKAGKDFGGFDLPWLELNPDYAKGCVELRGHHNGLMIGPHNFDDFLQGKVKPLTLRGTAIVQQEEKVLLVKEKKDDYFSLPGGSLKKGEPALAAAIRELYEELGLSAIKAERMHAADFNGSFRRHLISRIEVEFGSKIILNRKELSDYLWWDKTQNIPLAPHVRTIFANLE